MTFFNPIGESWIYKLYKQKHMKTAMQELIEWGDEMLLKHPQKILGFGEAIDKAVELLEKEKEQIMMAFNDGKINSVLKKRYSEEYYNQTYNQQEDKTFKQKSKWTTQKQHIIDIMKADEDDGLYKMFDTDSDKKH